MGKMGKMGKKKKRKKGKMGKWEKWKKGKMGKSEKQKNRKLGLNLTGPEILKINEWWSSIFHFQNWIHHQFIKRIIEIRDSIWIGIPIEIDKRKLRCKEQQHERQKIEQHVSLWEGCISLFSGTSYCAKSKYAANIPATMSVEFSSIGKFTRKSM